MKLNSLPVIHRLNLIVLVALAGLLAIALVALYEFRAQMRQDQVRAMGGLVDVAQGTMAHFHALEQAGTMSRREAQRAATAALRAAPQGSNAYLIVHDGEPVMVLHPTRPELEGHDVGDYRDPSGKRLYQEFVKAAAAKGGGVVEYLWSAGGASVPRPRLAYAKMFEPWGWVVSAGVYADEVDAASQGLLYRLAGAMVVLTAFLVFAARRVGNSVTAQLGGEPAYAAGIARRVAKGDLRVAVDLTAGDRDSVLAVFAKLLVKLRGKAEPEVERGLLTGGHGMAQSASWPLVALAAERRSGEAPGAASAAVEEMVVGMRRRADAARDPARPASGGEPAAGGTERTTIAITVDQAAETIRQLVGRANEIEATAGTIKAIASQTNLIALNAVIDAARAGERGRDLAGAADKVRGLAERTVSATARIEQMLHNIRSATDGAIDEMSRISGQGAAGVKTVRLTPEPAHAPADSPVDHVKDTPEAARERGAAPLSVTWQIEQVARMVEGTGASMRSAVGAVAELERLAAELREMVLRFRK